MPDKTLGGFVPDDEASLDPVNWDDFARLAHRAVDDAIRHLKSVRERPVWKATPEEIKRRLGTPLPVEGQGAEAVYGEFLELILPYATGNIHPRFWGWVHGSGTPSGVLAEMLAATMNSNCGGRDHGAIYVERSVIDWCKQMFGFPETASGVLVTGTSMASLLALTVARQARTGAEIRERGAGEAGARLTAYASAEVHQCAHKAMEIMGLGRRALRAIPTGGDRRICLNRLQEAIRADRAAGFEPFCAIGSAGTVKTGAIDSLSALADICEREKLWFHVDGAIGGACALSDALRPRLAGIERADSIGFDFHKWLHAPYDAGCLLVRRGEEHLKTFTTRSDYLQSKKRGLAGGGIWPCDYGVELSRGFRALKIWFTLKTHGARRLGEKIEENCAQAAYLAELVGRAPELELLADCSLNIVCFRYAAPGMAEEELNALNEAIVEELHESGVAAPSTAMLDGRLAIRCAITNHRSRREDFDLLVREVLSIGSKLGPERERVAAAAG